MGDMAKVRSVLEKVGLKFEIDDFDHRIIVQKLVFLLQLRGMVIGYHYGMYLRGPYSPELTRELYGDKFKGTKASILTTGEGALVSDLVDSLGLSSVDLEISATYAFLRSMESLSSEDAVLRTNSIKPFFKRSRISQVISRTNGFLFPPTKAKILEMKEEFELFERASMDDNRRLS